MEEPRRPALFSPGTGPLGKLLALERTDYPRLLAAFAADGERDDLVRAEAIRKCLAAAPAGGDGPAAPGAARETTAARDVLAIALPAAADLLPDPSGRKLLARLAGEDHGPDARGWLEWGKSSLGIDGAAPPPEGLWSPLATRARLLLESSPAAMSLEAAPAAGEARASGECDILLALDTTESMAEPLVSLTGSPWLFQALGWAIPGVHLGLLCYDDEVNRSLPLGTAPAELDSALAGLRAEGGGDVPEGVLEALKAALQLGRFAWRPEARKVIVFVGDGPPRRSEVQGLLALAKECHEEGGYRIDAVSVNPPEGRSATFRFPELAAAGGGQSITAAPGRLAEDVFLAALPPASRDEVRAVLPRIAARFGGTVAPPAASPPASGLPAAGGKAAGAPAGKPAGKARGRGARPAPAASGTR